MTTDRTAFPAAGDRRRTWHAPLANMAMRAISLGARFILSLYIVHDLGLSAAGVFGIVTGIAGMAPSLCGFGISYFINREILTLAPVARDRLLRDRFCLNVVTACTVCALAWICAGHLGISGSVDPILIGAIITLEFLSFDLHIALINMRKPVVANFLLFIRSSSWIAPFILLGYVDQNLHTMRCLFFCWLTALICNFALLAYVFRHADLRTLSRQPVDWTGLWDRARRLPLLYVNDVASNGQVFLDRFIVLKLLGLAPTGLYTLYFSLTHGLYILVATAITQLSMPKLAEAKLSGGLRVWRRVLVLEGKRALGLAFFVVAAALIAALVLLPLIGFDGFTRNRTLLAFMALTALLKPLADLLNTGLYSLGEDRRLAVINLTGVLVTVPLAVAGIAAYGITGIGLSALITQLVLILARAAVLRQHLRREEGSA